MALDRWVNQIWDGSRPSDGSFISLWRLLAEYPELLAYERFWFLSQEEVYGLIYGAAKGIDSKLQVGWHIMHLATLSPFYSADQNYQRLAHIADFLKTVPIQQLWRSSVGAIHIKRVEDSVQRLRARGSTADALQIPGLRKRSSTRQVAAIRLIRKLCISRDPSCLGGCSREDSHISRNRYRHSHRIEREANIVGRCSCCNLGRTEGRSTRCRYCHAIMQKCASQISPEQETPSGNGNRRSRTDNLVRGKNLISLVILLMFFQAQPASSASRDLDDHKTVARSDGRIRMNSQLGYKEAYLPILFPSSHAANLLQLKNGDLLCVWFSRCMGRRLWGRYCPITES